MRLIIDADSCPIRIREVTAKAATRKNIPLIFVANSPIPFPEGCKVEMVITEKTEGSADDWIVENLTPEDIVITRDIPLADRIIDCGANVMNDRGNLYTPATIKERLSQRNFMYELRSSGIVAEKHNKFGPKEVHKFAAALDKLLTSMAKENAKIKKG